jgi:hypothetical protein
VWCGVGWDVRGEVTDCEQKCSALLRADPFNEEAGEILVNLMLHRELYDSAILHFQQILEHNPNHYTALAQVYNFPCHTLPRIKANFVGI